MSIIYKPRKMVCTIPGKEKTGYFAAKAVSSTIDLNNLCYRISSNCTITSADVKGVIEALLTQFELELLSGKISGSEISGRSAPQSPAILLRIKKI